MKKFMEGVDWQIHWDKQELALDFQAYYHYYSVSPPVVDPSNQRLFYNFFPAKPRLSRANGIGLQSKARPIITFEDDDRRFFVVS